MKMLLKYHLTEVLGGITATISALGASGMISAGMAVKLTTFTAIAGIWRGVIESVSKEHQV